MSTSTTQPPLSPHLADSSTCTQKRTTRRTIAVLFTMLLIKSTGPGFVNFAQQLHPLPGTERLYSLTPLAGQFSAISTMLLAVICIAVIYRSSSRPILAPAILIVVVAAVSESRTAEGLASINSTQNLVMLLLVALAVSTQRLAWDDLRVVGQGVAAISLASIIFAILLPANAQFVIAGSGLNGSKALIGDYVLAGPMTHSNTLGTFIALGIPFISFERRRGLRLSMELVSCLALIMSASRTAMLAIVLYYTLRASKKLITDLDRPVFRRTIMLTLVIIVGVLPVTLTDRSQLSTRVGVWRDGIQALQFSDSFTLGLGPYWDPAVYGRTISRTTSAHNLFVQYLVTGGMVLVVLGGILILLLIRATGKTTRSAPSEYLIVLFFISITEFVLPLTVASQLFPVTVFVLLVLLRAASSGPAERAAATIGPASNKLVRRTS